MHGYRLPKYIHKKYIKHFKFSLFFLCLLCPNSIHFFSKKRYKTGLYCIVLNFCSVKLNLYTDAQK